MKITLALLALSYGLSAATYYASPSGNDSTGSGTTGSPYKTVSKLVTVAVAGDTLILMDGTYNDNTPYNGGSATGSLILISKAGSSGSPITLKAQHKQMATLDCGNVDGATPNTGCDIYLSFLNGANWWVIQDIVFTREYGAGINMNDSTGASNITFKGNLFTDIGNHPDDSTSGFDGIYIAGVYSNITLDGNSFTNIGRSACVSSCSLFNDHGIYVHSTGSLIMNNTFYGRQQGWGVQTALGFAGTIANNTFAEFQTNNSGQLMLWDSDGPVTVQDNIFINPTGNIAINNLSFSSSGAGCVVNHNIVMTGSTIGTFSGCTFSNNTVTNPKVVSNSGPDLHLLSGSPAIGAGVAIAGVTTDYDGVTRPNPPAIGAFEFVAGGGANITAVIGGNVTIH